MTMPVPAGVDAIDQHWGGLYRGATYLVYGPTGDDRRALTLRFLQAGAITGETCLYVSPGPPNNLVVQAAALGLDLREAHESGLVKSLRFAPSPALQMSGDDGLAATLDDLAALICEHQPQRVVVDDFTPFVRFHSSRHLHVAFARMLDSLEQADLTLLLAMAPAQTGEAGRTAATLGRHVDGTLLITPYGGEASTVLRLTLQPGSGPHAGLEAQPVVLEDALETLPPHPATSAPEGDGAWLDADAPGDARSDRDVFGLHLQRHFHRYAVNETPFLLIAIRGDSPTARSLDFKLLCRCVRPLLTSPEDWFVEPARRRLVILLPSHRAPEARCFFARLKQRLRRTLADGAEAYLHAFSALVVPNGDRFTTADDFLTAVLDEDL